MELHGVPSAISVREAAALTRLVEGRRVVEAGALLGASTILMALHAASVVSIDRHQGYTAPTFRQFASNLDRFVVASKITPVVGDALIELPRFSADVGFIDLTGTFDTTLAAIRACRASIVAIHDLCRQKCSGVAEAIEIAGLNVVEHVDSLAICVRKESKK